MDGSPEDEGEWCPEQDVPPGPRLPAASDREEVRSEVLDLHTRSEAQICPDYQKTKCAQEE